MIWLYKMKAYFPGRKRACCPINYPTLAKIRLCVFLTPLLLFPGCQFFRYYSKIKKIYIHKHTQHVRQNSTTKFDIQNSEESKIPQPPPAAVLLRPPPAPPCSAATWRAILELVGIRIRSASNHIGDWFRVNLPPTFNAC